MSGEKSINFEFDLVAENSKSTSDQKKGCPAEEKILSAMDEMFYYIETNEDYQFPLEELKEISVDYLPANPTIISKLIYC